jgi:hypothetical protein
VRSEELQPGLAAAVAYVHDNGTASERGRLAFLLHGIPPDDSVVAELFDDQRSDGGFAPFWAQSYSSLDATCFRLAKAAQLGLNAGNGGFDLAVGFLASRQDDDDSWREVPPFGAEPPPWACPGNESATAYLTANCGYWLASVWPDSRQVRQALAFLRHLLSGKTTQFLQTYRLARGLAARCRDDRLRDQLEATLHRKLEDLSASDLAWLAQSQIAAGIEPDDPLIEGASSRLITLQLPDGRWQGEAGPGSDVHTTLESLFALRLCRLV